MLILVTVAVAILGGLIARKCHIPNPYMLGSLISVTILNVTTPYAYYPADWKIFAQILTGTFIGTGISLHELKQMKVLLKPIFISILSMLVCMFFSGYVLNHFFHLPWATALLASVPGGMTDITLMSADFGADISTVALFQTLRLLTVITVLPQVVRFAIKGQVSTPVTSPTELQTLEEPATPTALVQDSGTELTETFEAADKKKMPVPVQVVITLCVGAAGGILGKIAGIPAGPLSISMLTTVIFSIATKKAYLPVPFKRLAQVLSGALIGAGMTRAFLRQVPSLFLPIIFVMVLYMLVNWLVARIIARNTDMDMATAMFATAPGGAGDMALIASELAPDANHGQIVLIHITRLTAVVSIVPLVIGLILNYL